MQDLHQKIRAIRELKKYTQEYMAEQIGISIKTYGSLESGKTTLSIQKLNKISQILQVSVDQIAAFEPGALPDTVLNALVDLEARIKKLEQRVALLEQRLG